MAATTVLDVQALQNPHSAQRGIGRYVTELVHALERWSPGQLDELLLNPELTTPETLLAVAPGVPIRYSDRPARDEAATRIVHVPSPFEPAPIERVWPQSVRHLPLVVTVHDLIQLVFPEIYFRDPRYERWYRTRFDFLRRADRVLAVSEATASDLERFGIARERIVVTGEAASERFVPAPDAAAAAAAVRARLPAVRPGYLLYPGGMDPRKNIDRLLDAYAGLGRDLRQRHQLVVVCGLTRAHEREVAIKTQTRGIADDVLFTGYVPDDVLVTLYQSTLLTVFPSLYEGFGLPVAEALACGSPVLVAATSSLGELVTDPAAQFDPRDPGAIRDAIGRALTDAGFLARLGRMVLGETFTWAGVARRTADAYAELAEAPLRRPRRSRIAFVGAGEHAEKLASALARVADVDVYVPGADLEQAMPPPGTRTLALESLERVERLGFGYDAVIHSVANSRGQAAILASALRRKGGTVICHDVQLDQAYASLEDGSFADHVRSMYGERLPRELDPGGLDASHLGNIGVFMLRDLLARCDRFLVQSEFAATVARLDAAPTDAGKVSVVPFPFPSAAQMTAANGGPLRIAVAGIDDPARPELFERFLAALDEFDETPQVAVHDAVSRLAQLRLLAAAERAGIGRLEFVDDDERGEQLAHSSVAVYLATRPALAPTAAPVAWALAAGVPTVFFETGALRELPDDVAVKVAVGGGGAQLAQAVEALLRDPERRTALGRRARAFSASRTAEIAGRALACELGLEDGPPPTPPRVIPAVSVTALAPLLERPLVVVDVGSRWGFDPRWVELGDNVELIGFEPDEEECRRLRELYDRPNVTIVARALGAEPGERSLHVAADPGSSSLYSPDPAAMEARPELRRLRTVAETTIELTTLDRWAADQGVAFDVLKLDVQGAELDVLRGAVDSVRSVRLVEAEVEFNGMYVAQPLFADVDAFLRDQDFALWRLGHLVHYGFSASGSRFPLRDEHVFDNRVVSFNAEGGQLYWGQALYVRREIAAGNLDADWQACVRDAAVALVYGFDDLADVLLRRALEEAPPTERRRIRTAVAESRPARPLST